MASMVSARPIASMEEAFSLGQLGTPCDLLYSSPHWFAYTAGRDSVGLLGGVYPVLKCGMSRGYSVRVRLTKGAYVFRFSGDPLKVQHMEVGA